MSVVIDDKSLIFTTHFRPHFVIYNAQRSNKPRNKNDKTYFESREIRSLSNLLHLHSYPRNKTPTKGNLHPKKQKARPNFLKREEIIENKSDNFVLFRIVSERDSNIQADASSIHYPSFHEPNHLHSCFAP